MINDQFKTADRLSCALTLHRLNIIFDLELVKCDSLLLCLSQLLLERNPLLSEALLFLDIGNDLNCLLSLCLWDNILLIERKILKLLLTIED